MKYVGILNNTVIQIIESENEVVFGATPDGRKVLTKQCNQSDVAVGMIYNAETDTYSLLDEAFISPKSNGEKIQDNQLSIMEAMADQYEQQQEVNLNVYDVLATIYETVSGGVAE